MIREATSRDHRANTLFMKGFENVSKFVKVDVDYACALYDDMIKKGIAVGLMNIVDDELVGCLGFIMSKDLHSGEPMAVETFWYVHPDHQGKGYGSELLNAYEAKAKELGAKKVAMIHMADSQPEILKMLYLKRGYALIETHYVKEI